MIMDRSSHRHRLHLNPGSVAEAAAAAAVRACVRAGQSLQLYMADAIRSSSCFKQINIISPSLLSNSDR